MIQLSITPLMMRLIFLNPPDPGLNRTAEESSDEDNVIDLNAPVFEMFIYRR